MEFIHQCGSLDTAALPAVDCAVGQHYGVHSCRNLGHGPVANLVKLAQKAKPGGSSGGAHRCAVLYEETALCARDSRQDFLLERVTVGLQGDVGEEQALRCLLGAPLLEDLATWSHWELLFEPQLGALKKFIERGCSGKVAQLLAKSGFSELLALEVKPGLLLRLDPDPSPDKFDEAALRHDPVIVAGQLVSMVTADGLGHAPLALLANRMESVLASMAVGRGACAESSTEDEESSGKLAARFVLDCLCRIPLRLCKALAPQVLLEPCGRALGQTRSRELLGRVATDPRDRLRLQQLGLLLGITEWSRELQRRMQAEPQAAPRAPLRPVAAFEPAAAATAASDSDPTNGSEEEESGSVKSESKSDSESEDEETSDSSGDEEEACQKFALAPSTYEVEGNNDEAKEKKDEVVEEVASDVVADADGAAASEGERTAETTNADGDVGEGEEAPLAEEIPPTVEDPCRAIVEDIRRREFGIGVELSEDATQLMEVQQSRIGRSLERLSSELYSKDTHFVLELVQNADDNSYPSGPDAQPPSLLFVVENDRVTLLNNEVGFSERNVRYICDIGKSTKGKHKYGYIGQKGIGFKSVFKVTDRPEIHSNGFHLRFDRRSGPMGLILPHWVDEGRVEVGEGEEEEGGRRPLDLTGVPGEEDRWVAAGAVGTGKKG
uniref:Protein NO VEIN-like isoform X2 n=1 Tax=Petromyzon marinus TaxID=7757 RepID=A0AAJ7TSB6_PETMA|nr:protein NO VEIN-like isoform X2 [Petromyzon marinus]